MAERSINDLPEGYTPKLDLPDGYVPSKKEEYMCDKHIEYFRRRIEQWKEDLLNESNETIANLRAEARMSVMKLNGLPEKQKIPLNYGPETVIVNY